MLLNSIHVKLFRLTYLLTNVLEFLSVVLHQYEATVKE